MANNPKKIQDPTEAALSAIQEALEIRDDKTASEEGPPPVNTEPVIAADVRRNPPRNSATPEKTRHGNGNSVNAEKPRNAASAEEDEELFAESSFRAPPRGEEPVSRRAAANDDRQSIGQILQAVQRRPSRMSYTAATI